MYFNASLVSVASIVSNCGLDNKGMVFRISAGASSLLENVWTPCGAHPDPYSMDYRFKQAGASS